MQRAGSDMVQLKIAPEIVCLTFPCPMNEEWHEALVNEGSLHFFNDEVIQVNHEESTKVEFYSTEGLNWKTINNKI